MWNIFVWTAVVIYRFVDVFPCSQLWLHYKLIMMTKSNFASLPEYVNSDSGIIWIPYYIHVHVWESGQRINHLFTYLQLMKLEGRKSSETLKTFGIAWYAVTRAACKPAVYRIKNDKKSICASWLEFSKVNLVWQFIIRMSSCATLCSILYTYKVHVYCQFHQKLCLLMIVIMIH